MGAVPGVVPSERQSRLLVMPSLAKDNCFPPSAELGNGVGGVAAQELLAIIRRKEKHPTHRSEADRFYLPQLNE
jgi:hypothetical protein